MKKAYIYLAIMLLGVVLVNASWIDTITNSFAEEFGEDDVVKINDHQLIYFYEGNVTRNVQVWNETINATQLNTYTEYVYRAMLVDLTDSSWNYKISVASEVVIT